MHCIANKVNAWECARWQVRNAPSGGRLRRLSTPWERFERRGKPTLFCEEGASNLKQAGGSWV